MTVDKGKFISTIGWTTVGIGLYLVGIGIRYGGDSLYFNHDESGGIIDAEFTIVED